MFLLGVHSPSFGHSSCCCPLLSVYFLIIFTPLYFYRGEMDPWARWTLSSLIISVLNHFNYLLFFHFLQMLFSLPQSTCLECEGTTHTEESHSPLWQKKKLDPSPSTDILLLEQNTRHLQHPQRAESLLLDSPEMSCYCHYWDGWAYCYPPPTVALQPTFLVYALIMASMILDALMGQQQQKGNFRCNKLNKIKTSVLQ